MPALEALTIEVDFVKGGEPPPRFSRIARDCPISLQGTYDRSPFWRSSEMSKYFVPDARFLISILSPT